jgi:tetrahydroxynaphthalene reductase
MPGVTTPEGVSKYDQIPGPLGMASASLAGKVALVTGAGMFYDFTSLHV